MSETTEVATPTGWQPISTAPKDGTPILAYQPSTVPDEIWIGVAAWDTDHGEGWKIDRYDILEMRPTHWMPLPGPPDAG